MELETMTTDLAEEILRENGHAEEADGLLQQISLADSDKAGELIMELKQRAIRVLTEERSRERIDASWARLVAGGDIGIEAKRPK